MIKIVDSTLKASETPRKQRLDLQDALLIMGLCSLLGGIAHFSVALAAIVFGVFCLIAALRPAPASKERQS